MKQKLFIPYKVQSISGIAVNHYCQHVNKIIDCFCIDVKLKMKWYENRPYDCSQCETKWKHLRSEEKSPFNKSCVNWRMR